MKMTFQLVTGEIKTGEPKELAKVMFDFFSWQYKTAIRDEIESRVRYNSYVAANEAAKAEYDKEDFGGGFGPTSLPYNENALQHAKRESETTYENMVGHKKMLDFVVGNFIEKANYVCNQADTGS